MYLRTAIFKGETVLGQYEEIFKVMGTPLAGEMEKVCPQEMWRRKVCAIPLYESQPLAGCLPGAPPQAVSLFAQLCTVNPDKRATTRTALDHPYLLEAATEENKESARTTALRVPLMTYFRDVPANVSSPNLVKDLLRRECSTPSPSRTPSPVQPPPPLCKSPTAT
eukprot:TRINITY_DN5331_c0_g1_i1.p2 TRINITY_DN5331_c0_g1~~TRINITY_DN5331_c0_g1_i1.p2  ORF type:complete len:166 (+),score=45.16 TRINITY_DN5331_c0_g1_i1:724-1221(+)